LHPLFCDVLAVHYDQISGTRDRWQPAAALEKPIASLAMSPLSKWLRSYRLPVRGDSRIEPLIKRFWQPSIVFSLCATAR